jgi:uncharacterized protein (DUF433 family)
MAAAARGSDRDALAQIAGDRVCHGQACIKGTRIPVAVVLDNLAAGLSAQEIVASYPPLRVDDVRAATAYAAELARERIVEIGHRGVA